MQRKFFKKILPVFFDFKKFNYSKISKELPELAKQKHVTGGKFPTEVTAQRKYPVKINDVMDEKYGAPVYGRKIQVSGMGTTVLAGPKNKDGKPEFYMQRDREFKVKDFIDDKKGHLVGDSNTLMIRKEEPNRNSIIPYNNPYNKGRKSEFE